MMRDVGTLQVMRTAQGRKHHNAVRKRLLGATIKSITFLDDHRVMRDFGVAVETDWRLGGEPFHTHLGLEHWTGKRSYPASLTRGQRVRIRVELAPDPVDADPIDVELRATPLSLKDPAPPEGAEPFLTFVGHLRIGEEAQQVITVDLVSDGTLPLEVFTTEHFHLRWMMRVAGEEIDLGGTGPLDLYVTYGTPDDGGRPTPPLPGAAIPRWLFRSSIPLEDGLTHLRLREAVRETERLLARIVPLPAYRDPVTGMVPDSTDPHTIMRALLAVCEEYTLRRDPHLWDYAHSSFLNRDRTPVGAWPILHHAAARAQCQAIVRLARAMAMAIGLPGTIEMVAVYAHPDVGAGKVALVDAMLPVDQDPRKYGLGTTHEGKKSSQRSLLVGLHRNGDRKDKNGEYERLSLANRRVEVGEWVRIPECFNSYEACMRFTHGKTTRYYGGGMPDTWFSTAQQVLHSSFRQLAWTRNVEQGGVRYRAVTEIVANYPSPKSST